MSDYPRTNASQRYTLNLGSDGQTYSSMWQEHSLSQLPGCCGVVVSHNSYIARDLRGYGLGDYFHKERLKSAKAQGYSCIMATTVSTNLAEIHILEKNGWKKVHEFVNKRTNNTVQVWIKDI